MVSVASARPARTLAQRAGLLMREPHRVVPAVRRRLRLTARKPPAAAPRPAPPSPPPAAAPLNRAARLEVLTRGLRMEGAGLEIGASHNPLLLKADGHDIKIADHLDQDGLIAKYGGYKSTSRIEHVDYVLAPGRLTASIPDRFDYILASHVAEHTVCLVSFLQDCEQLLKPGGALSLALPDKRFCFDRFRERAALGRVIDTYRNPPDVHTEGSVLEHNLMAVNKGSKTLWSDGAPGEFAYHVPFDLVRQRVDLALTGEYVDTHNWVLTPNHFRLLIHDLNLLGFIGLREHAFTDSINHEFFITLSVDGNGPGLTREQLAERSQDELMVRGGHAFA